MSPWLLLFLAGALALYLLVVLPLSADENPLGRTVVVAPTLDVTVAQGRKAQRMTALVRRWERGWNGTKGEQRAVPDADGRVHFPAVTVRSWAARVVPHEVMTEQRLHIVQAVDGVEAVAAAPVWEHVHRSYADHPLQLKLRL